MNSIDSRLEKGDLYPGVISVVDSEVQPVPGYFVNVRRYVANYPGVEPVAFGSWADAEKWIRGMNELAEAFRAIERGDVVAVA